MILQMFSILVAILQVPIGGVLWFWGGCGADCPDLPPAHKSWRRHVWPAIAGLICLLNGVPMLQAGLFTAALVGVNTLGYGKDKPWWYRVLVGFALGLPFMILFPNPLYPLASFLTFIPLYALSRKYNWQDWRVVETATGAVQGSILAVAFMERFMVIVSSILQNVVR